MLYVNSPVKSTDMSATAGEEELQYSPNIGVRQALKLPVIVAGSTIIVEGDDGVIGGAVISPELTVNVEAVTPPIGVIRTVGAFTVAVPEYCTEYVWPAKMTCPAACPNCDPGVAWMPKKVGTKMGKRGTEFL